MDGDRIVQEIDSVECRMLEAHGRVFWATDSEKIEQLQELYRKTEDELENVK
jgi:cobalamin biosynthesis Mg chelatase CobN